MSDSVDVVLHVDTSVDVPLGQPGSPGQSAYALAVSRGFVGSEEQWLAEQKGADGQPGPTAVSADAGNSAVLGSDGLVYVPAAAGGASSWGDIGGTIADQADLQAELDAKADSTSLGTAAAQDATAFATAAQGAKADAAAPASSVYDKTTADGRFATAAQGAKADSAVQPGSLGSAASQPSSAFATAAQGAKADSAVQPGSLGTAAALNVPASGNAATGEVVKGSDGRLSDARTPTAHTHTASQISDFAAAADARVAAIAFAAGSADNPHKSASDARNSAVPKNFYQCSTTPTTWVDGDEWIVK